MDWNLNTPTEWDWENLAIYTSSTKDMENVVPKTLQFSTQENNVEDDVVDFSFSASVDSASKETIKTFGVFDDLPKDFLEKDDDQSCSWVNVGEEAASSVLSGEAMIGLKLGRHAASNNSSNKTTASVALFPNITSSSPMIKRSRASYLSSSQSSPRCQVEGCNLDLASAKDYHRRHRICANHSKSPKVIVAGMERRFCQQCSRKVTFNKFHDLSEFDDRKRSCRRRLSAHNARRRRPQSEEIQFGSTGMSSSSICDRRPTAQMSFLLNRSGGSIPILDSARPPESFKGNESSCTLIGLSKAGAGIDHLMPTTNALNFSNSERFIPRNNANHNAGMDNSILSGDVRHAAFSLLSTSTSSWSSSNWPAAADQESFDQFASHGNNMISLAQPGMPLDNTTTHLQDFQSFRSSHEFERFYSN